MIAAGRYLKQLGATTVGALGISLGGSAVLGACHPQGAEEGLDGGILAISPPADVAGDGRGDCRAACRASHPAYLINLGFWAMLTSRIRGARWAGIDDFMDPIERISAPYYGVEPDELWRRASAKEHITAARVPVLVLHPEDDQVIPVEHARMLEQAAAGNERVRVWVLPGGGHGGIDAVDAAWFYAVAAGFLRAVGRVRERRTPPPPPMGAGTGRKAS